MKNLERCLYILIFEETVFYKIETIGTYRNILNERKCSKQDNRNPLLKQVSVEGTRKWVVAVEPTQLVQYTLLRRVNVETKVLKNHSRNPAEFLLPDVCRGMSMPKMETVVLLQARRRVAALAQLHAVLQHCTAMDPVLQGALSYPLMLCFSEHCSGCAGSHFCAAHH